MIFLVFPTKIFINDALLKVLRVLSKLRFKKLPIKYIKNKMK